MASPNSGQRGEYREQTVTIQSVTQDRIKKGANRGRLYEKYEVEGFEDRIFYNFHDHLIGEIERPVRAKIAYFDDPKMPKVEKLVLLNDEPPAPQYDGLTPSDVLIARMSNVKSSVRALRYVEGTWEQRLKAYRELLEKNEEYILDGFRQRSDGEPDEDLPF